MRAREHLDPNERLAAPRATLTVFNEEDEVDLHVPAFRVASGNRQTQACVSRTGMRPRRISAQTEARLVRVIRDIGDIDPLGVELGLPQAALNLGNDLTNRHADGFERRGRECNG